MGGILYRKRHVATREGGVDRNNHDRDQVIGKIVATREGGVERNTPLRWRHTERNESPPARVAWIETPLRHA